MSVEKRRRNLTGRDSGRLRSLSHISSLSLWARLVHGWDRKRQKHAHQCLSKRARPMYTLVPSPLSITSGSSILPLSTLAYSGLSASWSIGDRGETGGGGRR